MQTDPTNNSIKWQVNSDKSLVSSHSMRILEINLEAPENTDGRERGALNLSLVLDRSGSMAGEPLSYVKKAAAHVIDLLSEKDRASVVVYDDTIHVLFPSSQMTLEAKQRAKGQLAEVRSGASTNLGGGWIKGCEEVARNAAENSFNRTLLLTDGLANVGMTSLEDLSTHARELFRRGVSTSTFGVGLGYDQHLLEIMASYGGGNFHYLETVNAIPLVFEREFLELINVFLKDVEIKLELPQFVKAETLAGYPTDQEGSGYRIFLGSLYSGRQKSLYLKLHFNGVSTGEEISIPVQLTGKFEDGRAFEVSTRMNFKTVETGEESSTEPDKKLMERFAEVELADRTTEALRREKRGDLAGASRIISDTLTANRPFISESTQARYAYMAQEFSSGLSEEKRKSHHRQQYNQKMSRDTFLDYPARLLEGLLITHIEGERVVIDTSSLSSAGSYPKWIFFNEMFLLANDSPEKKIEQLKNQFGIQADVLMGMDILKNYSLSINLSENLLNFSQRSFFPRGAGIALESVKGYPMIKGEIEGQSLDLLLQTSSKYSFVSKNLVKNLVSVDERDVYHPTSGSFMSPIYRLGVKIGRLTFELLTAVFPDELRDRILLSDQEAIIGSELFTQAQVSLVFPEQMLTLSKFTK